jgi:hypothetical protein
MAVTKSESPSRLIDAKIKELGDWRGKTLARVRALVKQADRRSSKSGSGRRRLPPELRSGPMAVSSARERRTRTSSR